MKRLLISTCLILFWAWFPSVVPAQNSSSAQSKKKVASAAELPSFTYSVPENAADLLTSDEAFAPFAAKVRADLEGVLRDYDIQDTATLKSIEETLMSLDFQQGKSDSALVRMARVRQLEEKPEAKLYNRANFVVEAIIKA